MKNLKRQMILTKDLLPSHSTSNGYRSFLEDVKKRIRSAQLKAAVTVSEELIKLYWSIGKDLVEKQEKEKWGTKFIDKFRKDIQRDFPGIEGFSRPNIFKMKAFYQAYAIVSQAVRQFKELPIFRIPWGHNVVLISKVKDTKTRLWYAQQVIENGWSRNMLERWIESSLHKRQGKAITNFKYTLPPPNSDLAEQTLKNPYILDILALTKQAKERELEQALVAHMEQLLLELGTGFSFVGRQYRIEVDDVEYKIDLLLYNFKLRAFFVIELKARDFHIHDTAQINFYLSAVDEKLKHPDDQPTIGILLYYSKNKPKKITVEYALRNVKSPIGVSTIRTKISKFLPKELRKTLPSVKELEQELGTIKL